MTMYEINYKGLHKRKNYEQLLDYLQNNQDMIRYPDRLAKQMRNHPYLTQFDSEEFGYMDAQQKEIKKQDAMTSTIREMASTASGPSTTDLLARVPPKPMPIYDHAGLEAGNRPRSKGFGGDSSSIVPIIDTSTPIDRSGVLQAAGNEMRINGPNTIAPNIRQPSLNTGMSNNVRRFTRPTMRLDNVPEFPDSPPYVPPPLPPPVPVLPMENRMGLMDVADRIGNMLQRAGRPVSVTSSIPSSRGGPPHFDLVSDHFLSSSASSHLGDIDFLMDDALEDIPILFSESRNLVPGLPNFLGYAETQMQANLKPSAQPYTRIPSYPVEPQVEQVRQMPASSSSGPEEVASGSAGPVKADKPKFKDDDNVRGNFVGAQLYTSKKVKGEDYPKLYVKAQGTIEKMDNLDDLFKMAFKFCKNNPGDVEKGMRELLGDTKSVDYKKYQKAQVVSYVAALLN